ncbi:MULTISPECIES: flavin-containing monooxygenase [Pseudomonas]|uniref:Baeyer-Villiger monooxygenase n=1 Tax=Pseudomonas fluorescens TaxID=294 RepID=A0A5E6SQM8_PSEFL|nr:MULTISPECIES: NAD(P)/FAD-dependent oxidoreductase [Pseudomonas]VVM80913.1 Baeyer-Villiger monooxygenase [Pseudomonas fluorescens]
MINQPRPTLSTALDAEVIIVGTGFSGQCMAIKLRQAGLRSVVLLERGATVGGTWRDNHYPGAACDIPSHLYSFSFMLNPHWSRTYPGQAEILAYLQASAERNGLLEHTRFNTLVSAATFDPSRLIWQVETNAGPLRCRFLILGTGGLSEPVIPRLEGLDTFAGRTFHSARWDHDYTLQGKRVAVIGSGASAIQFVPRIAPRVERLSVFQRTPAWIVPRQDRPFGTLRKALYRYLPGVMRLKRWGIHWLNEVQALGTVVDPKYMALGEKIALQHLHRQVADPQLRARLTPNYVMGCKRILISDDWYPALQRANTSLVSDAIERITPTGILTCDGRLHEVDAIIFGTGFQATEALCKLSIRGRLGRELNEAWAQGAEAYVGASVSGFPNLFLITGPNTGLGHNSMVFMIEANVAHIVGALKAARQRDAQVVEVKREVQARYNQKLQQRLEKSVWVTGCKSWYQDKASGKVTTLWPGFSTQYWAIAHRFKADDYLLLGAGLPQAPAPASPR